MSQEQLFIRDKRGDWRPPAALDPAPLFTWPPRPFAILKRLIGYLLPWTALYMAVGVLTSLYLTPELTQIKTLNLSWIALIFGRNLCILVLVVSAWHVRLYVQRAQGTDYKFNDRWLATNSPRFLFKNQVLDNLLWNLLSALPVWTAYEVLMLCAFANGRLHAIDWRSHPVYGSLLLLITPLWQEIHFYLIHRLLHWGPLYKAVHHLHHKNMNPGPWSGLAMHPIEHALYFSGVLIFWILPCHPLHIIYLLQVTALVPSQGHAGFDRLVITNRISIPASDYFHYLHHRYVECNYGAERVPLDRWFGTFHDGTPKSQKALRERLIARRRETD